MNLSGGFKPEVVEEIVWKCCEFYITVSIMSKLDKYLRNHRVGLVVRQKTEKMTSQHLLTFISSDHALNLR